MEKSTKIKWLWGIGIFIILAAIGAMQENKKSGDSKKSQRTERIAEQKQETKAERQAREQEAEEEEEEMGNSLIGTYEVTDKIGQTLVITLKDDETATVTFEGETYYCTWVDYSSIQGGIQIAYDSSDKIRPCLVFEGGSDSFVRSGSLKDGWYYASYERAQANNPQWRLPVKKIK